jgi:hypothetical protein
MHRIFRVKAYEMEHGPHFNEDSKITELQKEINELKNIIRKANQMVPQPMKEMLP